jgi:3-phenylpropionate/cinnamic acid dioxygenase small subunit
MSSEFRERVENLLYEEGAALDEQRWEDWLNLFTADCEYWMPAWDSEHEMTKDPASEISLIYYSDRTGLEDRIWRINSGMSSASTPLPRTAHMVSNIRILDSAADVKATFIVNSYRNEETDTFYGRYEYSLQESDGELKIARKKIILLNDIIPSVVDIYSI